MGQAMSADGASFPRMARFVLIQFSATLLVTSYAFTQLVNARFVTSMYAWEQFDTVGVSKKLARGFQSVILDVAQSDFSLHAHGQGAVMLQKKLDELPDYRLYYGYMRWKNIADVVDIAVGRVPFYAGVGAGTVDGGMATVRLSNNAFRLSAYGGANTPRDMSVQSWGPLKDNYSFGGQMVASVEQVRFGLSYFNRRRTFDGYWTQRPDSLFNPASFYVDPSLTKEQYGGLDVSYAVDEISFHARYDQDFVMNSVHRGQFGVRFYPSECWTLSAEYLHRAPRVRPGSFFASFDIQTTDEFEGGVDYAIMSSTRVFIRGAAVQYVGDRSFRYTAGIACTHAAASYRGSTGYAGELNAVSLQGSYPLLERMVIPTLGLSYSSYKLSKQDDTESAIAAMVGVIARPFQWISVDVQGQWVENKVYKNDVRLYAAVNIWLTEQLHIFE
jgi:hypothetical protein